MSSNDACEYQANKFPEIDSEVLDSDTSIDFNWESVTESRKTEKIEGNRSNVAQEIPVFLRVMKRLQIPISHLKVSLNLSKISC